MQLLLIIWYTCQLRKVKKVNKERICCPRGFFGEIMAFGFEKMFQIQTEIGQKFQKKTNF